MSQLEPRSLRVAMSLGAASLLVAACGGSEPGTTTPTPTPTATSQSPEDAAAAAQEEYWSAYVEMANSGSISAETFGGVADGSFVEVDLKILGQQADDGFVRVGAPDFSEFVAEVDGSSATSLVCVDFSPWGSKNAQGEKVEIPTTDPSPFLATLELRDGAWVMTDQEYQKETPCP